MFLQQHALKLRIALYHNRYEKLNGILKSLKLTKQLIGAYFRPWPQGAERLDSHAECDMHDFPDPRDDCPQVCSCPTFQDRCNAGFPNGDRGL